MNLKVKYTPVPVEEPETVKDFLTRTFGFTFWQNIALTGNMEGIKVGLNPGDEHCMILVKDGSKSRSKIIINTDDCLKDYDELVRKGLTSHEQPQYTQMGLAVNITDPSGNEYILLEERNYQEII